VRGTESGAVKRFKSLQGPLLLCLFALDLVDRSLRTFPVEKLDADSRTSAGNVFSFDVRDPAVEDPVGW
jgi:hypothetical protein